MEPYAQIPDAGPSAASADLFTILVEELQSAEAAGLTACGLEDLLCERGSGRGQGGGGGGGAAGDIAAFYAAGVPVPCTASTLLVISAGAKGIVMRPGALRPATAKAAARQGRMRTRLAAGDKPNRKRMATLTCVYDTEPAPRRPHDIIPPPGGRRGSRTLRPRPRATAT